MYKESFYNFKKTFDNGEMIIYNSKSGAVAVVDKEHYKQINDILNFPEKNMGSEFCEILYTQGFLVDKDENELQVIRSRYEKGQKNDNYVKVVMLPAEFCNLACPYCFIWNYREKKMKPEIYTSVIKYLDKKIGNQSDKKKVIEISWYGGEPLLMSQEIYNFMKKLKFEFSGRAKVKASIITNGYYLSQSCFNELCKNDVRMFQVTFDGAKESHDITRKLKDGSGGTFDKIMENIKAIKNSVEDSLKFEMAIRINFMKSTYKAVYGLIDELSKIINRDRRFVIYCRPVYNFETQRKDIESMQDDIFTIEEGLQKQTEFTLYIANKLNRTESIRSISDYLPLPAIRWCSEDSLSSIIVGYDGSIYFCDSLIGDEQFCVGMLKANGSIDYNEKNTEWRKNIFDMENMEQCKKCKCLPTCMGCCKRERILKNTTPCLYKEEDIYHYMQLYYENEYKR